MKDIVLQLIETLKLCLDDLRGQGYDNGSDMSRKNMGLEKRILDLNPRAFYVPCGAHFYVLFVLSFK